MIAGGPASMYRIRAASALNIDCMRGLSVCYV